MYDSISSFEHLVIKSYINSFYLVPGASYYFIARILLLPTLLGEVQVNVHLRD